MDAQPWPPSPAEACRTTQSLNVVIRRWPELRPHRLGGRLGGRIGWRRSGRDDADGLAATLGVEQHRARREREQRVVATAADSVPRVEVRPALPNDDLAGLDHLPAVPLDAEALGVGVPAVPAGGRALLVCHGRLLPGLDAGDPQLSQVLAVPLPLAVPGLLLVLENVDLRPLGLANHLGGHGHPRQSGSVGGHGVTLSLIHISEPTRLLSISYAV